MGWLFEDGSRMDALADAKFNTLQKSLQDFAAKTK